MQFLTSHGFEEISPFEYARGEAKINIALLHSEVMHDVLEVFLKVVERRLKPR